MVSAGLKRVWDVSEWIRGASLGDPSTVALKRCPSSDPKPTPAYSSAPYSVQSHTGLPYSSISPNTTRIHPTICNHITDHTHLTISTPLHFTLCHSTQISQVSRVNQYSESFIPFCGNLRTKEDHLRETSYLKANPFRNRYPK